MEKVSIGYVPNVKEGANNMPEKNDRYVSPTVLRVVADVRDGVKSKRDLEICGCPLCQQALELLEEGN